MSRALDREMCFVLLGRDLAAPSTIRHWCDFRLNNKFNFADDPQIVEARRCAEIMVQERDDIRREVAYEKIPRGDRASPPAGLDLVPAMFLALGIEVGAISLARNPDAPGPDTWDDPGQIPRLLCLVHSGVSKAIEAHREEDFGRFADELSGLTLRLVELAHGVGIDLGRAILAKVEEDRARGHEHGGKSC